MKRNHPESEWCRYADDGICHLKTREQAETLLDKLIQRFQECKLEIHPDKTKIVYCKDGARKSSYSGATSFVFLGYEFRARSAYNKADNQVFTGFTPVISPKAAQAIIRKIRELNVRNRSDLSLQEIAKWINPMIIGWINYYGKYTKSALNYVFQRINSALMRWSMKKYKKLNGKTTKASKLMKKLAKEYDYLFAHWKIGMTDVFI